MGRPRNFSREEVLEKCILVFWKRGFADTSMQDIEQATGVNKSGLYSEFQSKEEIFLESLKYYLSKRDGSILLKEPLGWQNIKNLLRQSCPAGKDAGCFAIYSIRELSVVPDEARDMVSDSLDRLRSLIAKNLKAVSVKNAGELADIILTFFAGICLEQNLGRKKSSTTRKIESFIDMLEHGSGRQ